MELLNDENENLILSQIADALENKSYEIEPFGDINDDILLSHGTGHDLVTGYKYIWCF